MSRKSDYVTNARQYARDLWETLNALEAMQKEWSALDYSNTMDASDAFIGSNTGLDATMVGSVVFETTNAIRAIFNAGHATNVARLL